jgi:LacI family transcriptional regulator
MSNRPTIADVARAAGVSKATVSRVLNNTSPYIKSETRKRVMQAVDDLQYRPNSIARSMTIKRTSTVGLLVSDVGNPFYADTVNGVEDQAFESDYDVYICNVRYDLERGTRFIRSLVDKGVDGIVFMSTLLHESWVEEADRHDIPVVVVDSPFRKPGMVTGMVDVDFRSGIAEMVDHFWAMGHRHDRYAHISGPLNVRTAAKRWRAFADSLAEKGVDEGDILLLEGNLMMESGRDALAVIMESSPRPTAVFAANDLTAMGLYTEAIRMGVRIPEDLSLCGLDDIWLAQEIGLTTVSLEPYSLGQQAMAMLLQHLNEESSLQNRIEQFASHLIVRDSTAPPPDQAG